MEITNQERAKRLVNKFGLKIGVLNKHHEVIYDLSKAKQCAIIAVDEIIEELKGWKITYSYWEEIKKEIELL